MNSQLLYNIQQSDKIRKLEEERAQLLKIHDKVCGQTAELLTALRELMAQAVKDAEKYAPEGNEPIWAFISDASTAIHKATA